MEHYNGYWWVTEVQPSPTQKEARPFLATPLPVPCHELCRPQQSYVHLILPLKKLMILDVVTHACNPSTVEAEAGGLA